MTNDEFGKEMSDDIAILRDMATKYNKDFILLSTILTTLAYTLLKAKFDMLNAFGKLCEIFIPVLTKELDDSKLESINDFLDTLDINPEDFKGENGK